MKSLVVFAVLVLSQSAFARAASPFSCSVTCQGDANTILATLPSAASGAEASDFITECTRVMGGGLEVTSPAYCAAYHYYCNKLVRSAYSASGLGDTLVAARRNARSACEDGNFRNNPGSGCAYDYRLYFVDQSSFECTQ